MQHTVVLQLLITALLSGLLGAAVAVVVFRGNLVAAALVAFILFQPLWQLWKV